MPIEILQDTNRPNPWEEQAEAAQTLLHRLATPDPADLERALASPDAKMPSPVGMPPTARGNDSNEAEGNGRVSGEILREFDLLADSKEKDVQEAWASAEGYSLPIKTAGTLSSWPASNNAETGQDAQSRTSQNQTAHSHAQSISSGLSLPSLASFVRSVQASVSETVAGLVSHPHLM